MTENIILGLVKGRYDLKHYDKIVASLAAEHGFDVDPTAIVSELPVGVQQKVEILKALYQNAQLLIMDEPTAVLTPQESDVLMNFVQPEYTRGQGGRLHYAQAARSDGGCGSHRRHAQRQGRRRSAQRRDQRA